MNIEKLRERRAALIQQRDEYLQQANANLAAMNGGIGMLDQLIADLEAEGAPDDEAAVISTVPSANGGKAKKELA